MASVSAASRPASFVAERLEPRLRVRPRRRGLAPPLRRHLGCRLRRRDLRLHGLEPLLRHPCGGPGAFPLPRRLHGGRNVPREKSRAAPRPPPARAPASLAACSAALRVRCAVSTAAVNAAARVLELLEPRFGGGHGGVDLAPALAGHVSRRLYRLRLGAQRLGFLRSPVEVIPRPGRPGPRRPAPQQFQPLAFCLELGHLGLQDRHELPGRRRRLLRCRHEGPPRRRQRSSAPAAPLPIGPAWRISRRPRGRAARAPHRPGAGHSRGPRPRRRRRSPAPPPARAPRAAAISAAR